MWYIHALEYYSVIKRNEILINAVVRRNCDDIILSERRKTKTTYYIISFICNVQNR